MFTLKRIQLLPAVLILLAVAATTAQARSTIITVDYPGAINTFALGINPEGDIVGAFDDANGQHAFLLRNGEFTAFDWPGALWTSANGINPSGDIVGQYGWFDIATNTYTTQGFLWRDGVFYSVTVPGRQNSMPFKINPDGLIVGCAHTNTSNQGGTDLATMTGFSMFMAGTANQTMVRSMNLGVNPDGDIVGYYWGTPTGTPSNRAEWSYLIRDDIMTFFQYPGAYATLATDINARGAIVGRYRLATPAAFHGFVLQKGNFETIDVDGASQTLPFGINPSGDITGYYIVGSGTTAVAHGFVLTYKR